MASTYTTNSGIEKPGDGEQSGTWGDTVNTNMDIIDTLVSGFIQITAGSTSVTLTTTDGSVTAGMNKAIKYVDSGDLGGNCTVTIAPNDQEKLIFVENGLSASRSLIFTQGSGANFTLQAGKQAIIRSDGAGSGAAVSGVLANLEITTLEVTGAAALDGAATLGSTLTVTGASQFNSTITAGVDDTGYDVKFFGDTASRYWLWDTSADGVVQRGALTVGVDDTGHDVKFFGDTASRYWWWDTSADGVVQRGTLTVGVDDTGHDVKFFGATSGKYWLWDESADGVVQIGTLTVGVDDTGHDVKFFGATSGQYMLWDESADTLFVTGEIDAGSLDVSGQIDVDGTSYLDEVTVDGDLTLTGANYNALWDKSSSYLQFSDNAKATFGSSDDLQIYHNSSGEYSVIAQGGSGDLWIGADDSINFVKANISEYKARFISDGAVELYYDASKKIETFDKGVRLPEASSIDISTPLLPSADHTYTGLTAQMLAGGSISAFDCVCIHTTTGEVIKTDASAYATARAIGIAPAAISDTATGTILLQGFIRDDSWSWTTGSTLYLSETQGAMTHTPPSTDGAFVNVVGVALEPDVVYINPSMDVIERA